MYIRSAKREDEPKIRSLWKDCFRDNDRYLNFYFNHRFMPDNVRLLCMEGNIIGMIHLLPCKLKDCGNAMYWYAVGIHSEHRGKGYFRYFCETVLGELKNKGLFSVCRPSDGLAPLYQKMGFSSAFWGERYLFCFDMKRSEEQVLITDANTDDFFVLFEERGSVLWDRDAIVYAIKENEFCGGRTIKITYKNKKYVGLIERNYDGYLIDSTNLNVSVAEKIKNNICRYLNVDRFLLRTAEIDSEPEIFGLTDFVEVAEGARIPFTLF